MSSPRVTGLRGCGPHRLPGNTDSSSCGKGMWRADRQEWVNVAALAPVCRRCQPQEDHGSEAAQWQEEQKKRAGRATDNVTRAVGALQTVPRSKFLLKSYLTCNASLDGTSFEKPLLVL
ncbi:hypothetical protein TREES_T100017089 [Tupaia chinensis]|uniref:Uncharacterized protein n=1 Tax=Tupaia chinensis TaxID=246437 RepID=L9KUR8_TUPCH|nr:hypothetical protein TREES_T100017089 [Tupaia chinensis]